MGRLSDHDANNCLDVRFGAASPDVPGTWWVGLSQTRPDNDGSGITEPGEGGYARVAVANDSAHWPPAAARTKTNGQLIKFPVATASWGLIGYVVLFTAASGGRMGAWGEVGNNPVDAGAAPEFKPGAIVLRSVA